MHNDTLPDPNAVFPVPNIQTVTYIKPTLKNKNILVGDFSYYSGVDFESCVKHFYPEFYHDKLIIGKFCQIASGVEFIMNGVNHQMRCASTFPFYIFEKWNEPAPPLDKMPLKGDTVIGNDVWIGEDAVIMPGIHIGDGSIIGAKSVVTKSIGAYSIAAGNPAKFIRKRFDFMLEDLLLQLKWWDLPIEKINELIPVLHNNDLDYLRKELPRILAV
ncbi:MAG: CatB-related O-acetyltransferase [Spirochaetaceae bacterium]|nr:CatB-related O-acetyltransferase [Spirochaetaceae bacterium]